MEDIYFDSHAHLTDKAFASRLDETIRSAQRTGVARIIAVGGDAPANNGTIALASKYPGVVYASVGHHPNDVIDAKPGWRKELEELASKPGVVALGETGLDFFRKRTPLDKQVDAFLFHLDLGRRLGIPVIIHQRSAEKEMLDILKKFKSMHGSVDAVMHCFAGEEPYARALAELGVYVSFSGIITYPRNRGQRYSISIIPEDRLLVETDAPFLPPEGHRGEKSEPAMLPAVVDIVAEQLRLAHQDAARITRRNAIRAFGIDAPDPGVFVYPIRHSLYVNMTNRCSNDCTFCPLGHKEFIVKGHNLRLDREPTAGEVIGEVERHFAKREYKEVVFCGLGEPTIRLDDIVKIGAALRAKGIRVRLDTNGQGSLINERDIVPLLKTAVDELSVSLNATSAEEYAKLSRPSAGKKAYDAVIEFVRGAVKAGIRTVLTVVAVPGLDVERAREIAVSLGAGYRIRKYDRLG